MDLDYIWLGIRYSDAGITTRSYMTLSSFKGDCLCVFGLVDASVGFRAVWSRLMFAGSHDRPTWQPCVGSTQLCMCLQQCVETKQWRHIPTAVE